MTAHLVLVSIGPVQEFIAQARRSRDLWFGSELLAEVTRAVANRVALEKGAGLAAPPLDAASEELKPTEPDDERDERDERDEVSRPRDPLTNRVLAVVDLESDAVASWVAGLRDAARTALDARSKQIRREKLFSRRAQSGKFFAFDDPTVERLWDEQVDSLLEFFAAWVEITETRDFAAARREVERRLTSRKSLREFGPWPVQAALGGSAFKSSLDGARTSLLVRGTERRDPLFERYRIPPGEQLDAVGLMKRTGGNPKQFVPLVNVATAAWIEKAERCRPMEFRSARQACEHKMTRSGRVWRTDLSFVRRFPFDAQVFMPSRWAALADEGVLPGSREEAIRWGQEHIAPVGEPDPHVACIVADGDDLGKYMDERLLDGLPPDSQLETFRSFAAGVSGFAQAARSIFEQNASGLLLYAGGEDVLGFACLADALACAQALRDAFETRMRVVLPDGPVPTLSVGIGIGHVLDDMGGLLELGREALELAKGRVEPPKRAKNALGIVVEKRSGGRTELRLRWDDDPVRRIEDAVRRLRGGTISTKKVHEIEALRREFPDPAALADRAARDHRRLVFEMELRRVLGRSERAASEGPDRLTPEELGIDFAQASYESALERTEQVIASLLIAKLLLRHARDAGEVEVVS